MQHDVSRIRYHAVHMLESRTPYPSTCIRNITYDLMWFNRRRRCWLLLLLLLLYVVELLIVKR